jgi:hypothetical protein
VLPLWVVWPIRHLERGFLEMLVPALDARAPNPPSERARGLDSRSPDVDGVDDHSRVRRHSPSPGQMNYTRVLVCREGERVLLTATMSVRCWRHRVAW